MHIMVHITKKSDLHRHLRRSEFKRIDTEKGRISVLSVLTAKLKQINFFPTAENAYLFN